MQTTRHLQRLQISFDIGAFKWCRMTELEFKLALQYLEKSFKEIETHENTILLHVQGTNNILNEVSIPPYNTIGCES